MYSVQDIQPLNGFSVISKCMTLDSCFTLNSGWLFCVVLFAGERTLVLFCLLDLLLYNSASIHH